MLNAEIQKNGNLAPCCRYRNSHVKSDWHFRRFEQWWHQDLRPLRQDLLAGREHEGCENCWRDERVGVRSYRQEINAMYNQYLGLTEPLEWPVHQMYNFGTHCNLRCIMCSPYASSSLETEYLQNQSAFNGIGIYAHVDNEVKWYRKDEFLGLREKLLAAATSIMFQGGEPLLSPDVLSMLADHPTPNQVAVSITTNLTTLTDRMIESFHRFAQMNLVISLEGVGGHNDYLRYGSTWKELEANVQRVIDQGFNLKISHTFQRTSLYALPELIKFGQSVGIPVSSNILDDPAYLAIRSSPAHERASFVRAVERLPKVDSNLSHMKDFVLAEPYDADLDQQFWRYVEVLDNIRGTDFGSVFTLPA